MPKATPREVPAVLVPIDLRDDGTVVLRWKGHEVCLDLPLVKQLASFWDDIEKADAWRENDGTPKQRMDLLREENSPYAVLYARIIRELGSQEMAVGELPPFLLDGTTFAQLWNHWWEHPLARSARLRASAELSALMTMSEPPSPPPPSEA